MSGMSRSPACVGSAPVTSHGSSRSFGAWEPRLLLVWGALRAGRPHPGGGPLTHLTPDPRRQPAPHRAGRGRGRRLDVEDGPGTGAVTRLWGRSLKNKAAWMAHGCGIARSQPWWTSAPGTTDQEEALELCGCRREYSVHFWMC